MEYLLLLLLFSIESKKTNKFIQILKNLFPKIKIDDIVCLSK